MIALDAIRHCRDYAVESPDGHIGTVAEVRYGGASNTPTALAIRAGRAGSRLLIIPVSQLVAVGPSRRVTLKPSPDIAATEEGNEVIASFVIDARAPANARRAVIPLTAGLSPQQAGVLALLVSEVVTNAVMHGAQRGEIRLRAERRSGSVWVEVTNPATGSRPRIVTTERAHFGLPLVEQFAADWGHGTDGRETRVWFETATLPPIQ